ncbi:MAG: secretin N-terminal domain-containing protein [Thermodesulfovibrionales bacterium]|nr:secretin N-terminal domain-containing protein [Thermodesulfovibrionales bacterium]
MPLRTLSALIAALLILSCAPKKDIIKKEPAPGPAPIENIVLPELPPKPEPAKKKPEPVRIEQEKDEKYIILNFEAADIETVIASFGELLEMNYILTPGISGKVTIQSYKKFPIKDLFRIFQTILEINGITAVRDGAFYRIVPIDTAKMQPLDVEKGKGILMRLDEGFVTQLVPFEYVKASEMANVLRSLAPRGTDIIIYEPSNILIVTALPYTLNKFMKLVEAIDVSEADRESLKTYVYHVENGEAKKLAEILKTLYVDKKGAARTAAPATAAPATARRAVPSAAAAQGSEELPGSIGEVTVTAYEDINALIIQCSPRSYLALLEVMKKIDVPVKQVLIEVLIAEVSLGDDTKLGLEWLLKTKGGDAFGFNTGGTPSITTGAQTFSAIASTSIDTALFNYVIGALSQTSKLNVLASPHILAMDNKEASIHIGEETPIATGVTTQPGSTSGVISTGQIQYKTVGTILTVKPHITEKDRVTLEITQEVSQVGSKSVKVAGEDFASFDTRKAKTTAVVQNGHTLLLGGLIRESKSQVRSGIPFLSKIPILGYLFSATTDTYARTELLLMVTPHVISTQDDADTITRDFQNRVKTIKKRLTQMEEEKNLDSSKAVPEGEVKSEEE